MAAGGVRVEVFHDHEVMYPPNRLIKALAVAGPAAAFDIEAVQRAEKALAALGPSFAAWMEAEVAVLDVALKDVRERGSGPTTGGALFRAVHDIKGSAATYGFPAASTIAASLCRLLDALGPHNALPLPLVDTHVEAIRAIVRQGARDEDATAAHLAARLGEVVEATIAAQGS